MKRSLSVVHCLDVTKNDSGVEDTQVKMKMMKRLAVFWLLSNAKLFLQRRDHWKVLSQLTLALHAKKWESIIDWKAELTEFVNNGKVRSKKSKKNNTRDSNVVPHRSTNRARRCLTLLSRREAVLSSWYGRSCLSIAPRLVIIRTQTTQNITRTHTGTIPGTVPVGPTGTVQNKTKSQNRKRILSSFVGLGSPCMLLVQSMMNTVYCIVCIRIQLFGICWSCLTTLTLFGMCNHNYMIWHPYALVRQIGKEKESQEREETLVSFSSLEDIPKKEDFRYDETLLMFVHVLHETLLATIHNEMNTVCICASRLLRFCSWIMKPSSVISVSSEMNIYGFIHTEY